MTSPTETQTSAADLKKSKLDAKFFYSNCALHNIEDYLRKNQWGFVNVLHDYFIKMSHLLVIGGIIGFLDPKLWLINDLLLLEV